MLKRLVNECRFTLVIQTEGPVLVKSGYSTVSGPDMTPVRTYRNGQTEVYLPGSSLKGVFRSHIEKVVRTLKADVVCNPFVKMDSCSDKFETRKQQGALSNEEVYRDSCPACRLFGSTSFIGRIAISDAYLAQGTQERTEQRASVGIDRFTNGVASGPFDSEVVSSGVKFETNLYLRNFEIWQLGMLMLIVKDLEDGLIRIGSGRSRGLGNVKAEMPEVAVNYLHLGAVNGKPAKEVWGLGKLLGDGSYGTDAANDQLTIQPSPPEAIHGIRKTTTFTGDGLKDLKQAVLEAFVKKIQSWNMPKAMTF